MRPVIPLSNSKLLCARRIIELRKRLGLTQLQFAQIIGSNHASIVSQYECAKKRPSPQHTKKISLYARKQGIFIEMEYFYP